VSQDLLLPHLLLTNPPSLVSRLRHCSLILSVSFQL